MQKSDVLYEPLPIGRIGVRKIDQEVIVAKDFSCFANMLEEYICFGTVNIVIPKSAPEITTLDQMPSLLRKRIKVIDDDCEIEAMRRLLFHLRNEFNATLSDEDLYFNFPKDTPREIVANLNKVHFDVKRLAIGFNHGIQVDIDPEASIKSLRFLRDKTVDGQSKVVLAQLEALLRVYGEVKFDAASPPRESTPKELISIFDRLINDAGYLEYSDAIVRLGQPSTRDKALIELREIERGIRSNNYISTGWNYLSKALKVWTGLPIPESGAIASIVKNRSLPPLVNMTEARKHAVEMWKNTELIHSPLRRDGKPVSGDNIHWLPPMDSMEIHSPDNKSFNLGTVGELVKALEKSKELLVEDKV